MCCQGARDEVAEAPGTISQVSDEPSVRCAQGEARGLWRDTHGHPHPRSAAFLGLPFAEPPIGAHRFGAPVPAGPWQGVRDATSYGPTPQRRDFGLVTAIPEPSIPGDSTLNVNVFTPAPGQPSARLPVLVWIHGGGFEAGSPASPWYDGRAFNRDGVVTVTLSYRLGFDGFGWIPDAPHNRGLLDQIEALRWVRRNITEFGGDPDNVCIAGQSAGGGSVWALLVTEQARGLFGAAISQSGPLEVQSTETAAAHGRALAELAGVPWTKAGLAALSEDQILDLQARIGHRPPPRNLADALQGIAQGGIEGTLAYQPYLDGDLIPHHITAALAAGTSSDIPLIAGATSHEFTALGQQYAPLLADHDLKPLLRTSPYGSLVETVAAGCGELPGGPAALVGQTLTELVFRVPLVRWAELRGSAPTWLYDFRLRHPETGLASHCAELPYVWDLLDAPRVGQTCGVDPPQELADLMHRSWVSFVHDHQAPWPAWRPERLAAIADRVPSLGPAYQLEYDIMRLLP